MSRPKDAQPCQCGSGNFCRRHGRYGNPQPKISDTERQEVFNFQKAGGGIRILKRVISGSNVDY